LAPQAGEENTMDDVKNQMEGVTRTYTELDNKMADKGGVQNLFGMNRKIRQALESITIGELDSMLAEIHRAKEGLARLQEDIVEIRVLKEVLSAPMLRPNNGLGSANSYGSPSLRTPLAPQNSY
jgi:hypothetical protein